MSPTLTIEINDPTMFSSSSFSFFSQIHTHLMRLELTLIQMTQYRTHVTQFKTENINSKQVLCPHFIVMVCAHLRNPMNLTYFFHLQVMRQLNHLSLLYNKATRRMKITITSCGITIILDRV